MEEKNWLDYLVASGTIATPVLVLLISAIIWRYQRSIERKIKSEEQLRDDRIEIYNQILEPFIIMLMSDAAWTSDPKNRNKDKLKVGTAKLTSLEYRKASFKLSLIGSDSVVKSFNNLMQDAFSGTVNTASTQSNVGKITLLGDFLLAIRKSIGNESTKLDNWDMLEWFITDARKFRKNR